MIWRMNSDDIYLTFDDGPHPEATLQVLDSLRKHNVRATFFLSGKNILRNESIVKKIKSEHHSIGIHAYLHTRSLAFSKIKTINEIKITESLIHSIAGKTPKIFRPPYGFFSWNTISAAKEIQYKIVMWSCLTGDFRAWTNEKISAAALRKISTGSILVFHDNDLTKHKISSLLDLVIPKIQEQGFSFGVIE